MTKQAKAETIELAPSLKAAAAEDLLTTLRDSRGADLILDASKVEFLGGGCLQALLSAVETWRADGARLTIEAPSAAFAADAASLGAAGLLDIAGAEAAQ